MIPRHYTYLSETKIEQDAIDKALEVVGREIDKIPGATGDDVRWYMDVFRAVIGQKDAQIKALREALQGERELTGRGECACSPERGYQCVTCTTDAALGLAERLP